MLDDYHDNLIKLIKDHKEYFAGSLQTVNAYLPDNENMQESGMVINTPAAIIDIEMIEFGEAVGDGRDTILCNVAVHCLLSTKTKNLQRQLRNFASQMLLLFNNHHPDFCSTDKATEVVAVPGNFQGGKQGYDSWVVSFTQSVLAGESVWDAEKIIPSEVFFGTSAEKNKYIQVV